MEVTDSCSSGGATGITSLSSDIISSHILTKLDGPSLASTSCLSRQLHTLCSEENHWKNICNSTFPSTTDPLVHNTISSFPSGHRSFFSDTLPIPTPCHILPSKSKIKNNHVEETLELISAVDVKFGDSLAYSEVVVTGTQTGWFMSSPFQIDLVEPKESFRIPVKIALEESQLMKILEKEMKLSWIIIDPVRKRSVNLSSHALVDVWQHWYTDSIEVRYATVMAVAGVDVSYVMTVTCGGRGGGELHVTEISMQVENIEGKVMNGKDTLVILHEAMEGRRRTKLEICEMKERYKNFLEMRRMWRENKQKREKIIDMLCMASRVIIFIAFWSLIFFS